MLSKEQIKWVNLLKAKKIRNTEKLFIAEGTKLVNEIICSNKIKIHRIFALKEWINSYSELMTKKKVNDLEIIEVNQSELKRLSNFITPNQVLAILQQPKYSFNADLIFHNKRVLLLDGISDPGNLGAIIRVAAWYGISDIICSLDSVDLFNPKVIHATMGGFLSVQTHYHHLPDLLQHLQQKGYENIYGATLNGESIYSLKPPRQAAIIIGNESNGISENVRSFIKKHITIPYQGSKHQPVDSLNAAMVTAIICSEFNRTHIN